MEYPQRQWERIMRIQELFQRANQKSLTWKEVAQIMAVDDRTVRRWKERVNEGGFVALLDGRTRRPSPKRAPERVRDHVQQLYRDLYREWNVKHFHEQLAKQGIAYGYTWTKKVLQQANLVDVCRKTSPHREKRERKPLPGMMLHMDGSDHCWIPDLAPLRQDLIVIMDDATNEVYDAKLVDEENTLECMVALKEVVATQGVFCSIYSDRASHFFYTPQAGQKVDQGSLTQIGQALQELSIQMIPAYSPQARGRSERLFGTWQGRLPNELKLHHIKTVATANHYIQQIFIPWHNQQLKFPASQEGSAFTPYHGKNLDYIFSIKDSRVVNHDNTIQWNNHLLQIKPSQFRISFAKCKVMVHQHLDSSLSVLYGPHLLGRFNADGSAIAVAFKLKKAA